MTIHTEYIQPFTDLLIEECNKRLKDHISIEIEYYRIRREYLDVAIEIWFKYTKIYKGVPYSVTVIRQVTNEIGAHVGSTFKTKFYISDILNGCENVWEDRWERELNRHDVVLESWLEKDTWKVVEKGQQVEDHYSNLSLSGLIGTIIFND